MSYESVSLKKHEFEEQTDNTPDQNDDDNGPVDSFPLGKLQEVEAELAKIISTGIQDTSFMCKSEYCVMIRDFTNKLFPEPQTDDFGVDVRLKNVVRALGEGSVLPLTELVNSLKVSLGTFFDLGPDDKLYKLVPVFLSRKNLGEPYVNLSGIVRSECKRKDCMWIWETPTLEVFPQPLLDQVRSSREARNLISRRYKALSKLKNSIITEDLKGQQMALETLNTLDRKMLLDKERKERMDVKRKSLDKKKNEKLKVQKTNSNMLLSWLKVQKAEDTSEPRKDTYSPTLPAKERKPNIFIDCSDKQRSELESILDPLSEFSESSESDPHLFTKRHTFSEINNPVRSAVKEENAEIFKLSNLHRDVWTRFHTYLEMNRQFYVDSNESRIWVDDPLNNVEQVNHNSTCLKASRHCRVFSMYDNAWKRPPMRYLVGRNSALVTRFNQVTPDPNVDYCVDSDEDWFERYDADDVEVSEEEEEDDEDEEQEWIVQDSPRPREFSTGVFDTDLSKCVKVYCIYKNWHWIIDGKPVCDQFSSKEVALENGINVTHSEYGFGFEGYTGNPIVDLMRNLRGTKITMSRSDVEDLLRLCHGKHTRKEDLIAIFKESKPFASMSEIKNKFKKYMTRLKIDDKPHRWMVTPEAAKLFNIRKELDRILTHQLNTEILSEPFF
uniref:Chromatin assembly factor 1 subunit A n=1 Tax=Theileria parva TaxID=5875 RepID=Q4N4Z1_THEPA|eukprot:XP_765065.1 hypothetical protein [Theileria parva strain Muguga]